MLGKYSWLSLFAIAVFCKVTANMGLGHTGPSFPGGTQKWVPLSLWSQDVHQPINTKPCFLYVSV